MMVLFFGLAALIVFRMGLFQFTSYRQDILDITEDYEKVERLLVPERGMITDAWGSLLAGNIQVYEIGVNIPIMQENQSQLTIQRHLDDILGNSYAELLEEGLATEGAIYYPLDTNVSSEKAHRLMELQQDYLVNPVKVKRGEVSPNLEGLEFRARLQRVYPENELASNIIGFFQFLTPEDNVQKPKAYFGVEQQYDDLLSGNPIRYTYLVDPRQVQEIPELVSGASISLTIDRQIQAMVEDILDQVVEGSGSDSGSIVVLQPETGEILALAVTPRIDPNQYWEVEKTFPDELPLRFNRAVSYPYEPGSTFKVITMASALDAGTVTPSTPFLDTGIIYVGGIGIQNWDRGAWGPQDMLGCMQHSLNVCLAWVATEMGAGTFYEYMDRFGIGQMTNVDIAGEVAYPVAVPGDPYWSESNLGANAFGQALLTTPLQLASAISAVANDGKSMAPHIVKSIVANGKEYRTVPQVLRTPIKPETAHTLNEMLAVSLEQEASNSLVEGYRIAGKTGTAQIAGEYGYTEWLTNASFVGWGPVDDPKFLVYITLEKPESSPWGSVVAAPVFAQVVEKLVIYLNIPPDEVRLKMVNN
jgi:cell division protein FtsI/penicillin-binding protein 2